MSDPAQDVKPSPEERKLLDAIFEVIVRPPNDGRTIDDALLPLIRSASEAARKAALEEAAWVARHHYDGPNAGTEGCCPGDDPETDDLCTACDYSATIARAIRALAARSEAQEKQGEGMENR